MTTTNPLKAHTAKQSTDTLMGALFIMEQATTLSQDERLVKATISDVITERHNLNDLMDEVFMDDEFAGSYTDAIMICLARVAA